VIRSIAAYVGQLHPGFVPTQSHMSRTLWRFVDRALLPSEHIEAKVMEFLRKGILTKRPTINGQHQELITTELNPDHPLVQKALPDYAPVNRPPMMERLPGNYVESDDEYDDDEYDEYEENAGNLKGPNDIEEYEDEYDEEDEPPQPLTSR